MQSLGEMAVTDFLCVFKQKNETAQPLFQKYCLFYFSRVFPFSPTTEPVKNKSYRNKWCCESGDMFGMFEGK